MRLAYHMMRRVGKPDVSFLGRNRNMYMVMILTKVYVKITNSIFVRCIYSNICIKLKIMRQDLPVVSVNAVVQTAPRSIEIYNVYKV